MFFSINENNGLNYKPRIGDIGLITGKFTMSDDHCQGKKHHSEIAGENAQDIAPGNLGCFLYLTPY